MRPTRSSQILAQVKAEALLISNPVNILYLTGVEMSYGFLLVRPRSLILFADGRYLDQAREGVYSHIRVRPLGDLPRQLNKHSTCGFESESVTVTQLKQWKKTIKGPKFVATKGVIETFRRSKDAREIRYFKKSQQITSRILDKVGSALKPGITELKLAWQLKAWANELGAHDLSFEPIVAFGTNTAHAHHHPTKRALRKGHLVQIDMGVKYQGYCSDQSRVFFTQEPTAAQEQVQRALIEAKAKATKAARANVSTKDLDKIAREVLKRYQLDKYFTHALGHGVGLEVHEGVSLSPKTDDEKLLPGEIITIEPGVYLPGKFGMRLEDEVIIS